MLLSFMPSLNIILFEYLGETMNLFSELKNSICKIVEQQFGELKSAKNLVVEFPKNRDQGHFATNAAMII